LILVPCIYSKKKAIKKNIVGIITHYIDKNNKNVMSLKKNLERQNFNVKMIDIEVGNNYQKLIDEINEKLPQETLENKKIHNNPFDDI
jgi:hypothetical protein